MATASKMVHMSLHQPRNDSYWKKYTDFLFHAQKSLLKDLSIFHKSNLVKNNLYQFFTHNVCKKKFILNKFFNDGIDYFFCRIEKIINFIPKERWTSPPRGRWWSSFGLHSCVFIGKINEWHFLINEKSNREFPGILPVNWLRRKSFWNGTFLRSFEFTQQLL